VKESEDLVLLSHRAKSQSIEGSRSYVTNFAETRNAC